MPVNLPSQRRLVVHLVRLVLGAVFLYATVDKVIHPAAFAQAVYRYQIFPDLLVNLIAIVLPWLELVLGLFLIFGIWLPGAVMLCNFLLAFFVALLLSTIVRGLEVDCGCFVVSQESGSEVSLWWEVLRDAVFLGLALYLFFQIVRGYGRGSPSRSR